MRNLFGKTAFAAAVSISFFSCSLNKKTTTVVKTRSFEIRIDSSYRPKPKSFYENIVKNEDGNQGFCRFFKVSNKYYFEIPDSVFGKDILVVNRIAKAAAVVKPDNQYAGYGADQIGESIIQFCKGANNKIFIKKIEYSGSRSIDSGENGLYRAVMNSNLSPIMAAFDVQAWAPDSSSALIDMTEYISKDNELFFFSGQQRRLYNLGRLEDDRSYIQQVSTFPLNIEIKTVKTFTNGNSGLAQSLPYLTYELNTSMVLLPQTPMRPRLVDQRVGYFGRGYVDFDIPHPQGFNGTWMATRWRLEPKKEDIDRYNEGELVEPQKPIIYYIDPATPKKWIPYLIKGVNAWQKAFEKAGFKNAIYAVEAPVNDPSWSLEDSRHSAIVYKASWIQNASGPNVNDPRTGEILESHINWYHNVTEVLRDWYFTQASPSDPAARKMEMDDSLMGKLITYVCSHEVGHTLGLAHNFASSSTVPVDSLRSKSWVDKNGICPSIMDYARFNYVAQPEDSLTEKQLIPGIGAYDEWAIEWGYRWLPTFKNAAAEKEFLNNWVINKLQDPALLFTYSGARCQAEDLGDDAVKAGSYGIRNLQRIMPQLQQWTRLPNENYESVSKMEDQLTYQFNRYLVNAGKSIGGTYFTPKTVEQEGVLLEYVGREKQKAAVDFLTKELFTTPRWLCNNQLYGLTGGNGYSVVLDLQKNMLGDIMSRQTLTNLIYCQSLQPTTAYTPAQLLGDLESGIWSELSSGAVVDLYRRNLQKAYVAQLLNLQNAAGNPTAMYSSGMGMTDLLSVIKAHKFHLQKRVAEALAKCRDEETRWHLLDIAERLKSTNGEGYQNFLRKNGSTALNSTLQSEQPAATVPSFEKYMRSANFNCWGTGNVIDQ